MDFIDRTQELASRVPAQLSYCQTEEATKNALIMPFINALGYDVFNPAEVVPEFTADIGTKKGEKADYAIMKDGKPSILFECKWSGADLSKEHASQLFRYFAAVPEVRFGVLTNGLEYHFYSDLDATNRMDSKPFFVFDIQDFQERDVFQLKKFTKSAFDLEEIRATASDLKYTAAITRLISNEFDSPSDDFVSFFARQVYSGRMTQSAREQFSEITQKALRRFLSDRINERLQSAIEDTREAEAILPPAPPTDLTEEETDPSVVRRDVEKGIVTTEDEIEGFFAVKSILRDVIDVKRVHMRDTKSYCGVLLDDNNRKPICRLRFSRDSKQLGLFDEDKREERIPIDNVDDIYEYTGRIVATVRRHDAQYGVQSVRSETSPPVVTSSGDAQTNYTGRRVSAVKFKGQKRAVKSWKDAMMTVFDLLRLEAPGRFEQVAVTMVGSKRPHITRDPNLLRKAEQIAGTDLYVEINLSSQMIASLCFGLVQKLDYSDRVLAFDIDG